MSAEVMEQSLERGSVYGNLSDKGLPARMTDILPPQYFDEMSSEVDIDLEFVERKTTDLFSTSQGMELGSDGMTEVLQGLSAESRSVLIKYLEGSVLEVDPEAVLELDTSINKKTADYNAAQMGGYALEVIISPPPIDPDWRLGAECLKYGYDTHFPDYEGKGGIHTKKAQAEIAAAKAICRYCVARPGCLAYALSHDEKYGVWAGLSPDELEELKA